MSICMIQPIFTFDKLLQRLQLGKEVTPFVIWRENDLFGTHDNPVKIDIPCLFFVSGWRNAIGYQLTVLSLQP